MKKLTNTRALLITVILLIAALGAMHFLKRYLNIPESMTVTIILGGALAFGILSGQLQEVALPGGWGAKFVEQAEAAVAPSQYPIDLSTAEMEEIPKLTIPEIETRLGFVRDGRPLVMTLIAGKGQYYQLYAVAWALQSLSQFRNFKLVALLDQQRRVVAYGPSWLLRAALERGGSGAENLIAAINHDRRDEILAFPGLLTETVTTTSTNAEALSAMERLNLEALVVVDQTTRELRGVVERDRILARMVLALTPSSASRAIPAPPG